MAPISTLAWVAHNLGIAVGVGGGLFGRIALEPSMKKVSDREQRGRILNDAWRRFGGVQLGALSVMAGTWIAGRTKLTGQAVSGSAQGLVIAKDLFVGASLLTAVGSAVSGNLLAAQRRNDAVPFNEQGEVAADAPSRARALGRVTDALGLVNLIAGVGIIATTTMLSMSAGKSVRWSAVSRLLP